MLGNLFRKRSSEQPKADAPKPADKRSGGKNSSHGKDAAKKVAVNPNILTVVSAAINAVASLLPVISRLGVSINLRCQK